MTRPNSSKEPVRANIASVKAHFSRFLRRVRSGEEVTILNRDRPVAKIVPVHAEETLQILPASEDPSSLATLLDLPPVGQKTNSLQTLLEDRRRR